MFIDLNLPTNSPAVNSEVQEAGSYKYGSGVVLILPLSSGRFAVLDNSRQLREILDKEPSAEYLRETSKHFEQSLRPFTVAAEPSDREYARHLARVRGAEDRGQRTSPTRTLPAALDINLDEL